MRSRIVLLIAIVALVLGVVGGVQSLNRSAPKPEPTVEVEKEEYITVWLANEGVVKGQPLATSMVTKTQMPLSQTLELGIKQDVELDFNPSTLTNRDIVRGEAIMSEYQTKKDAPGYVDLLITEGKTLYPLVVSEKNLINDYIRPGSYVDILTVSSPQDNLSGNINKPKKFQGVRAKMFLKNIKVLNIGSDTEQPIKARSPSQQSDTITVVIEVEPDDLARLALAQRTMHIEIYRSQQYTKPTMAEVRNVIDNYVGIQEFRGKSSQLREAM